MILNYFVRLSENFVIFISCHFLLDSLYLFTWNVVNNYNNLLSIVLHIEGIERFKVSQLCTRGNPSSCVVWINSLSWLRETC